jgi:hypothetical protein
MIKVNDEVKKYFFNLKDLYNIYLEGNILKVIDSGDDKEFAKYIETSIQKDKEVQRKRLDIMKQVQSQNRELTVWRERNEKLTEDLKAALVQSEKSKEVALADLDLLQKKNQFELINMIVRFSLFVIVGVGISTTVLYGMALYNGWDVKLLESAWSNMFSILLTNCFSIIGTIMGVKYMLDKSVK